MTTTATFEGSVTLYSNQDGFPGPKTVNGIQFDLVLSDDKTAWTLSKFAPVVVDGISTPLGPKSLTVSLVDSGQGTFDPSTGALSVNTAFEFKLSINVVPASMLALDVTTTQATMPSGGIEQGKPVESGTGSVRLVAAGTFVDGFLAGKLCGVILEGIIQPGIP